MAERQYSIELRVDFADQEKHAVMKAALQQQARHLLATANLLKDKGKPEIAIFSDDYFTGHEKVAIVEDTIQKGIDAVTAAGGDATEELSPELIKAFKEGL